MPLRAVILDFDQNASGHEPVAFIRRLAESVPVALCSGEARAEVTSALGRTGLIEHVVAVVSIDDHGQAKPDPSGHLLALARLNEERGLHESIVAADVLAIEDSLAGVQAARGAGLSCAALAGDEDAEAAASFVIERLDAAAAERLLG